MTDSQWKALLSLVKDGSGQELMAGFIVDSPWVPGWCGMSILDYFTSDECWLKANLKVCETFPEVVFLPGFWSEYGMCTERSAFGAKCVFWKNEFPFAHAVIKRPEDIDELQVPDPSTDGLLPFMLNRLVRNRSAIEAAGHRIRFSVSRGPLNIASFLMGTTELLTTMMMDPQATHRLLRIITDFLKKWHALQRETMDSIDGIMLLDDLVGFIGEEDFLEFAYPYLKELYEEPVSIKLFHNDADCRASVRYYADMGVNLYNPGIYMSFD
jgi:uroporphyrinogen decarboxylase